MSEMYKSQEPEMDEIERPAGGLSEMADREVQTRFLL